MGALSPPLRTSPKLRSVPLTHSLSGASPAPPSPRAHRSSQSVRQVPRKVLIRAGIAVVVLIVIALLSLRADGVEGVRRRLLGLSVEKPSPEENTIVDLERDLRITAYDGGIPGYSAFSNLYLYGGVLTATVDGDEAAAAIPPPRSIMCGTKPEKGGAPAAGRDRWEVISDPELIVPAMGKRAVRVPGVTYIFNDPPGKQGFMAFYEHFVGELFVPAAHMVASAYPHDDAADLVPTHIIFPRCPSSPSWRDDRGENLWFLQHVAPDMVIEDGTQWQDRTASDLAYIFDRVVIVDRASAHSAQGDTAVWGKMNMIVPSVSAPMHFWDPFRENVLATIGPNAMPHVGKYRLPVVVYLERADKPRLASTTHDAIVAGLQRLTKRAEVHVADWKAMSKQQRIALMSRASILVGLSSDDLMEAIWMPTGRGHVVIELFEEGGFQRDIEAFTTMLNLDYMAIQNDEVLTEKMWREHGRMRGPDKNEVTVDANLVVRMVELQLHRL